MFRPRCGFCRCCSRASFLAGRRLLGGLLAKRAISLCLGALSTWPQSRAAAPWGLGRPGVGTCLLRRTTWQRLAFVWCCPIKGASTSGIGHKGSSAPGTGHNSPAPCGLRTRPAPLGALRAAAKDRDTGAVDGSTAARDPLTAAKATRRASWRRSQVSPGPPAGSDASSATAKFG